MQRFALDLRADRRKTDPRSYLGGERGLDIRLFSVRGNLIDIGRVAAGRVTSCS